MESKRLHELHLGQLLAEAEEEAEALNIIPRSAHRQFQLSTSERRSLLSSDAVALLVQFQHAIKALKDRQPEETVLQLSSESCRSICQLLNQGEGETVRDQCLPSSSSSHDLSPRRNPHKMGKGPAKMQLIMIKVLSYGS